MSKVRMEILVRIANVLFSTPTSKKTQLYLHSKTNWNTFERHMKILLLSGYVLCKTMGKDEEYLITEVGRESLSLLLEFNEKLYKQISISEIS